MSSELNHRCGARTTAPHKGGYPRWYCNRSVLVDAPLTFICVADGNCPAVIADHRRLSQVIVNLLSNAIKYNRPAGRVDVSYTVSCGAVDIIVSDTGAGISDEDLPRLFVAFDRIDAQPS